MNKGHEHHKTSKTDYVEYLKFYGVLLLILIVSGWLYDMSEVSALEEYLRYLMGVFFLVFSAFKLAGYKMFTVMFAGYDLIAKKSQAYAKAYPFIELGLAGLYLADFLPGIRDWIVLILLGIGSVGVIQEIYHRRNGVHCACLGNVIKLPLSTVSLVEDLTMALMAGWMIIA